MLIDYLWILEQDVIEVNETLNMTALLRKTGLAEAYSESPDAIYRLSGYLNHRGKSTHVGHYTASVAYPKPDDASGVDWFEFDDSAVNNMTSIVDTEGTKERNGKILRSRDAYMLLYVRDESVAVLSSSQSSQQTVGASSRPSSTILPSKECVDEIETLNTVFDADVSEYAEKAEALEARIQARLDAYYRFFEKDHPYPKPEAEEFYWVDTSWLRSWIVGKETQPQVLSEPEVVGIETANGGTTATGGDDDKQNGIVKTQDTFASQDAQHDSSSDAKKSAPTIQTGADLEIPFAKPIDVNRFCCIHSIDANTPKSKNAKKTAPKPVRFSPENINKLKRVSASFFEHLKDTCGIAVSSLLSPASPESKRSRRTSGNQNDASAVFDATSFRCRSCEAEFCNKLLDDAELLREIELEMQLLKTPVQPDDPNPFLMSRAWIASYKAHLQNLQKKILQKPKKKFKKTEKAGQEKELTEHFSTNGGGTGGDGGDSGDDVWRSGLNEDITCAHGKLFLKKKKYRSVPEATWLYFSQKFSSHFSFEERTAEPCSQCQVDEAASEEFIQVERACRDEILSRAPLNRLYRRKAAESGVSFSLRDAFSPPGPLNSTTEHCKMFLVPRTWMLKWREYIRNVEQESPPSLTCSDLMCTHNKLLLPHTILMCLKGASVEASSVEVEFVSEDEMKHLAELYGVSHCTYYYGLLQLDDKVVWKCCSLASLVTESSSESAVTIEVAEKLEGCSVDDGNSGEDSQANCLECAQMSEIQHLDELQNFQSRVVQVHLLSQDQPVPSEEKVSVETSASGRQRRSKRIRSGTASWHIVANSSDSIYVLKTKIYEEIDAYPIRQRLYFKGSVLEDRLTLKDCG